MGRDRARKNADNAEYMRLDRIAHRDKYIARGRAHYAANSEIVLLRQKEARATNPASFLFKAAKQRAKKKNKPISVDLSLVAAIVATGECIYCRGAVVAGRIGTRFPLPDSASLDCVVPALGYVQGNVVLACVACNISKNTMDYKTWRAHILRLAVQMRKRPEAPNE